MTLYLNLLPKEEKKNIVFGEIYNLLFKEVLYCAMLVLMIIGIAYYVKKNMQEQITKIETLFAQNQQINESLVVQVERFNNTVEQFTVIQEGSSSLPSLLFALFEIVPEGVRLNKISQGNDAFFIEGTYEKRNAFLLFESNLKANFLTDVTSPFTNLLAEENGSFSIRGVLMRKF